MSNLFECMKRSSNPHEVLMKKRVSNGYNEDKVVSVLLEMSPVIRIEVDKIPNVKGCLNAFDGIDTNYATYSAVAFKPNLFTNNANWDRERSLLEMKKYTESVMESII